MEHLRRRGGWIWLILLLLWPVSGCQVQEALIDGFYGGISDAVAAVVAEALLNAAGP